MIVKSSATQNQWAKVPAPERGNLLYSFLDALVNLIDVSAQAITIEQGKIGIKHSGIGAYSAGAAAIKFYSSEHMAYINY